MAFNYDGREIDLMYYLPPVYRNIQEFKTLVYVYEQELKLLYDNFTKVYNGAFIFQADEEMLVKWEEMLEITPLPNDTLENRRFRIFTIWNSNTVYTEESLNELLNGLCGANNYLVSIDYNTYHISVKLSLSSNTDVDTVINTIKNIIPANMVLEVGYLYNTHETLSSFTHGELSAYTHYQLREEVFE